MAKKKFNHEVDFEVVEALLKLPLERRIQEIRHCDLGSLAKAMTKYPNWQVEFMAEALKSPTSKEFVKTVKIFKGEIPYPKKNKPLPLPIKKKKKNYLYPVIASIILVVTLFVVEKLFP